MPKLKNHSGAKKRFAKTTTGKYKRRKAGRKHLLTPQSGARKREMRQTGIIEKNSPEGRTLRKFLPMQ
ncbi:large subunit ribosomal protein L35 [Parelusimicrobium proximum]|uniref:50S ribosomal protein L35 n=1 Tax=Parelusimicrobium proximum TaxID=3228953 RepID=UPI003D1830CB